MGLIKFDFSPNPVRAVGNHYLSTDCKVQSQVVPYEGFEKITRLIFGYSLEDNQVRHCNYQRFHIQPCSFYCSHSQ
jgi:hypothetical protein